MRAYFFGNMYMSSLQQGLQSGHCIAEIFVKYQKIPSVMLRTVNDWADQHKTMILLNGGYHNAIKELTDFFNTPDNPHPWAFFRESDEALGGIQTTVGIILPEYIYSTATTIRSTHNSWDNLIDTYNEDTKMFNVYKIPPANGIFIQDYWTLNKWEIELIDRLNTFGLAK